METIEDRTTREQDAVIWERLDALSQLPQFLSAARDPDGICKLLDLKIPEFASGLLLLHKAEMKHLRYKNLQWTGAMEILLEDPATGKTELKELYAAILPPGRFPWAEMGSASPFRDPDWQVYLRELNLELAHQKPETVLESLDFLIDPEQARQYLEEHICKGSPRYANLRIESCRPNVVRYKPGSRCTIVYHLGFPTNLPEAKDWPEIVVAKTYRGEKGQNAYDSMQALWNSPLGSSQTVKVAEALAYIPEDKVLIQGPIWEEQTLKLMEEKAIVSGTLGDWDELSHFMRLTARGLALLHNSGVHMGRTWRWEDERNEVTTQFEFLAEALPQVAGIVDPLLTRLARLVGNTPEEPLIPSHGSFRPAQVLIHQGKIGFIDFDSFCQSQPGLDLGLFLATFLMIAMTLPANDPGDAQSMLLDEPALEQRLQRCMQLQAEFLDEYAKLHRFSPERLPLWETLYILTGILHAWTKVHPWELKRLSFLLERFLQINGIVEPV